MFSFKHALFALTLTTSPLLSAHAAQEEVANCYTQKEVKYSFALTYDAQEKTLAAVIVDLANPTDRLEVVSDPLLNPPVFYDHASPTILFNDTRAVYLVFGTKNQVLVTLNGVERSYACPLYFPERIGMTY